MGGEGLTHPVTCVCGGNVLARYKVQSLQCLAVCRGRGQQGPCCWPWHYSWSPLGLAGVAHPGPCCLVCPDVLVFAGCCPLVAMGDYYIYCSVNVRPKIAGVRSQLLVVLGLTKEVWEGG